MNEYLVMSVGSVIIGYSLYFGFHSKAQEQQKKVVVAGCVPQAQPRMDYLKGLSIIGVCYLTHTCITHISYRQFDPPFTWLPVCCFLFYFGLPAAQWINRPPCENQPALLDGN